MSQGRFKISDNVCPDGIFWFFFFLCNQMYHGLLLLLLHHHLLLLWVTAFIRLIILSVTVGGLHAKEKRKKRKLYSTMGWSAMWKEHFVIFNVKVTVRPNIIKIWLSSFFSFLPYLLLILLVLPPNLVWWFIIISQSVLWKTGLLLSQSSSAKVQILIKCYFMYLWSLYPNWVCCCTCCTFTRPQICLCDDKHYHYY